MSGAATDARHFISEIIDGEVAAGRWGPPGDASVVRTRFPPEPNGFMHIGHAKAVCLNFGLAERYGGRCNLRFDDTNPVKEEAEFVDAFVRDVRWLGFDWDGEVRFASDYFERMFEHARELVRKGLAYVDEQTPEEIRAGRGTLTSPGADSPFRDRPAEESLGLLDRMRAGEFPDGSKVLRARIDMASPNMNLRDPVMYRVLNADHHRTGDAWRIYPMYDWAHGLEDSYEGVTHSLCTLEFEDHRPLYDWFLGNLEGVHRPRQIEFSRLDLDHTVMSKRHLKRLVDGGHVEGWDDPRMSTLAAHRRRGYTPEAIRAFATDVGVTKFNSVTPVGRLEAAIRDDLNTRAPRRMAVLRPLRVVIENWPEGETDPIEAVNNPEDESAGTRSVPFSGTILIERDDFMVDPPKKYFRLAPGREVRLRSAFWITCTGYETDDAGEVTLVRATYDPETRGGGSPPPDAEGKVRKVKGTLHWVSEAHAARARVRLFDRLFNAERPGKRTGDPLDDLNPDSLEVLDDAALEPALAETAPDEPEWADGIRRFQFERLGYFCVDTASAPGALVFNRTATLKDSWAKIAGKG